MEYPKYQSHKLVSAVKIAGVDPGADGSLTLELEGNFDNVVIPQHERRNKPHPQIGHYLVRYEDGYVSFSPADVFEAGYTPIAVGEGVPAEPTEANEVQVPVGESPAEAEDVHSDAPQPVAAE